MQIDAHWSGTGMRCLHSHRSVHTLPASSIHRSPFPSYHSIRMQDREQAILLMSSTGQATSSTSTIQSIIDALADYTNVTGIDLSDNPFATAIEHLTSPEAVLGLLQEREKAFREYRDTNRRLTNCLGPAVKAIQAFSGILGEAASLVNHICHPCSFFIDFFRSRFHQQMPCSRGSILSSL